MTKAMFWSLALATMFLGACSNDSVVAPDGPELALSYGSTGETAAVELPFEGSWNTTFTPPDPNTGIFQIFLTGRAHYLGVNTGSGASSVGPTGIQTGSTTYIAANGDELYMDYAGPASAPDAEGNLSFGGEYTFVGGTGRFEGAGGTGTYSGSANLFIGVGQTTQTGTLVLVPGTRRPTIAN